ncbi:hypothetical protein H4R19_000415 [Coemansia spiralis]|nr:hypothetical protein H4R19_000415 [Coemansia spiralis]
MGKRKSARKVQGKKAIKLDTTFTCLHCNHEKSVTVKIDKDTSVGTLKCKVCGQTFQSKVTHLEGPVDVYAEWVDACERVNREGEREPATRRRNNYSEDEADRSTDDDAARRPSTRRRSASPAARRSAARDEYGVPAQLSDDDEDEDDESEIDDF